jgi:hypothetical protein
MREALGKLHKRLLYCINVNRTSLDHLLLGKSADVDRIDEKLSREPIIALQYFLPIPVFPGSTLTVQTRVSRQVGRGNAPGAAGLL